MTGLPGIGAVTRFGVSRTASLTTTLARTALRQDADREAFRSYMTGTVADVWDVTLDTLVRARLIERTTDRLLSGEVVERVALLTVDHPATARVVSRVVESAGFEALITRIVESPAFERLVLSVVHSEAFDRLLDRALASEQLDRVVIQIAESEEVYAALRQQSAGVADEVTDELRSRTIAADALLERFARALIRRRPPPPQGGPAGAGTP